MVGSIGVERGAVNAGSSGVVESPHGSKPRLAVTRSMSLCQAPPAAYAVAMKKVLLTGMSGTGKSALIRELAGRGYKAVDADYEGFSELVSVPDDQLTGLINGQDWVWREDRIQDLLSSEDTDVLFISGCAPNQWKFYPQFDHVVLLSAPPSWIVERLATRTSNPYGQHPDEVARVLLLQQTIEPRLRSAADLELDTSAPLDEVVARLLRLILTV
jgi:shikimate kinase